MSDVSGAYIATVIPAQAGIHVEPAAAKYAIISAKFRRNEVVNPLYLRNFAFTKQAMDPGLRRDDGGFFNGVFYRLSEF